MMRNDQFDVGTKIQKTHPEATSKKSGDKQYPNKPIRDWDIESKSGLAAEDSGRAWSQSGLSNARKGLK